MSVLQYYEETISSPSTTLSIPAVMVYNTYVNKGIVSSPTRRNIRLRDKDRCGYCYKILSGKEITIDHIIPSSRFTNKAKSNTWENQIVSCKKCNNKKGNRTPKEANMQLLHDPIKVRNVLELGNIPEEWMDYLR